MMFALPEDANDYGLANAPDYLLNFKVIIIN
jgi:hypothetical protein